MADSRWSMVCLVFMMGSVFGLAVCIDNSDPGAPGGLEVSGNVGSILLKWGAAADSPSCSGIDYYIVSRNGVEIGRVMDGGLSMVDGDSLGEGEYAYTAYAVDLVGRNVGASVKNVVSVRRGGSSGGSSSSGFVCEVNWSCGEWSDCVGGDMRRVCVDLEECGTPYLKPVEYLECGDEEIRNEKLEMRDIERDDDVGFLSAMTGAVIGGGAGSVVVAGVFVLLVGVGFVLVVRKRG